MGKDRNSYSKTDLEATFMTKGLDSADEREPYVEWAVKASIQCPDRSRELFHCPQLCEQRPDGLPYADPCFGKASESIRGYPGGVYRRQRLLQ